VSNANVQILDAVQAQVPKPKQKAAPKKAEKKAAPQKPAKSTAATKKGKNVATAKKPAAGKKGTRSGNK